MKSLEHGVVWQDVFHNTVEKFDKIEGVEIVSQLDDHRFYRSPTVCALVQSWHHKTKDANTKEKSNIRAPGRSYCTLLACVLSDSESCEETSQWHL
jgi:putative hemolysin